MNTSQKHANGLLRSGSAGITQGKKVSIGPCASKSGTPDAGGQATVNLNRGSNGVESIEVTCACGEKIMIRCDYDQ